MHSGEARKEGVPHLQLACTLNRVGQSNLTLAHGVVRQSGTFCVATCLLSIHISAPLKKNASFQKAGPTDAHILKCGTAASISSRQEKRSAHSNVAFRCFKDCSNLQAEPMYHEQKHSISAAHATPGNRAPDSWKGHLPFTNSEQSVSKRKPKRTYSSPPFRKECLRRANHSHRQCTCRFCISWCS
jgi:hypothetical protein